MNVLGVGDILRPLIWHIRVHTIHLDRFSLFFCRPLVLKRFGATLNGLFLCKRDAEKKRRIADGIQAFSPSQWSPRSTACEFCLCDGAEDWKRTDQSRKQLLSPSFSSPLEAFFQIHQRHGGTGGGSHWKLCAGVFLKRPSNVHRLQAKSVNVASCPWPRRTTPASDAHDFMRSRSRQGTASYVCTCAVNSRS